MAPRPRAISPLTPQQQARARRWQGSRLERNPLLREPVLRRLGRGWPPQQAAGRLVVEAVRQRRTGPAGHAGAPLPSGSRSPAARQGGGACGRGPGRGAGRFPAQWRRTVVFDNGAGFARHYRLHPLGAETFFCDVGSPWQKGGAENRMGRLRRFRPRKADLSQVSGAQMAKLIQADSNTPRKCLGYFTLGEFIPIICCA